MSVIKVVKDWSEQTVSGDAIKLTTKCVYSVEFDNADDPEKRLLLAYYASDGQTSIPAIYAAHPYNRWLFVVNKHVDTIGPFHYKVTVNYSSTLNPSTGQPQNPLLEPPTVRWFFAIENIPISVDLNGRPLANSAGQTFNPPIIKPVDDLILHIERNELEFKPLMAAEYKGAINSDIFMDFPPGHALCKMFEGNKMYAPNLIYFKVTYEFQFRWREVKTRDDGNNIQTIVYGWILRILDQGYIEDTGETNPDGSKKLDTLLDKKDITLTEPVTFDGTGKRITKAVENNPPLPESCFLKFDTFKKKPFSVLNL